MAKRSTKRGVWPLLGISGCWVLKFIMSRAEASATSVDLTLVAETRAVSATEIPANLKAVSRKRVVLLA